MDRNFTLAALDNAASLVYQFIGPTPQYCWPSLCEALGTELWVKHENHTPTGAFKVRGGITFIDWLRREHPAISGVVSATRGNHGQSIARAATAAGLDVDIVVPFGNAIEKNHAMKHFGANLIEFGQDFDEARLESVRRAKERGFFHVPPYHEALVQGVASYALELFRSVDDLDTVYVPIGCGSGICGVIKARDALGLATRIVGVVSTEADAALRAFASGQKERSQSANTIADGMAVREVVPEALAIYRTGADRVISVSDEEVAEAMRLYFTHTHNVSEGAGAAPLAAAMQEKALHKGKKLAVILCGGNVDSVVFRDVLGGLTPRPGGPVPKLGTD
ncbi:MAG: threonine dehydratase [Pseudomonadota bacterium]